VPDVVGEQRPPLLFGSLEQRLVADSPQTEVGDGQDIVSRAPQALGDQAAVVLIEPEVLAAAATLRLMGPEGAYILAITMAKVMVSLPRELLDRFDRYAREQGTSRSGLLRRLAERELAADERLRAARVEELLGEPGRYGGDAAAEVRRLRATR